MTEFNANYYMQERANERARWAKALAPVVPRAMVTRNEQTCNGRAYALAIVSCALLSACAFI